MGVNQFILPVWICILKIDWNQEYLWYEKIVVSVIFDSNLVFGHACNWVYNIQIFPKKTLKMFQTTVKDMDVNLSAVCMFFPLRKQVIFKVKPT